MSLTVDEINSFSSSHSKDQTWWRWTHGESGSISSSSDSLTSTLQSNLGSNTALDGSKHALYMEKENAGVRSPSSTAIRWQKRASRMNGILKDNDAFPSPVWSTNNQKGTTSSPQYLCPAPLNSIAHSMRSKAACSSQPNDLRKRNLPIHHSTSECVESSSSGKVGIIVGNPKNNELLRQPCTDIKWSLGTNSRRSCKKDKRNFRNSTMRPTDQSYRYRSGDTRSEAKSKPLVSGRQVMFQSFRRMGSMDGSRDIQGYEGTGKSSAQGWKGIAPIDNSFNCRSSATAKKADMVNCSERVLKESIQQDFREGNVRKRTVEGYTKADVLEGKGQHSSVHIHTKNLESHCSTCCSR